MFKMGVRVEVTVRIAYWIHPIRSIFKADSGWGSTNHIFHQCGRAWSWISAIKLMTTISVSEELHAHTSAHKKWIRRWWIKHHSPDGYRRYRNALNYFPYNDLSIFPGAQNGMVCVIFAIVDTSLQKVTKVLSHRSMMNNDYREQLNHRRYMFLIWNESQMKIMHMGHPDREGMVS